MDGVPFLELKRARRHMRAHARAHTHHTHPPVKTHTESIMDAPFSLFFLFGEPLCRHFLEEAEAEEEVVEEARNRVSISL